MKEMSVSPQRKKGGWDEEERARENRGGKRRDEMDKRKDREGEHGRRETGCMAERGRIGGENEK